MDQETLGAYDAGAAGFAKDWHEQPAPVDLHALVNRFFQPMAAPPTSAAAAAARWPSWPPPATTRSATMPPTRCSSRRGCAIRG